MIPVVAIGGIVVEDVAPLLDAGLYGIAFSGMLVHAEDRAALVQALDGKLATRWKGISGGDAGIKKIKTFLYADNCR